MAYSNEDRRILYLNRFINSPAGGIDNIVVTNTGSGYTSLPTVTVVDSGGPGTGAVVVPYRVGGNILGLHIQSKGSGYINPIISVNNAGSGGTGFAATVGLTQGNSILGFPVNEDEVILDFCLPNNFNHLFTYDLHKIAWSSGNTYMGSPMAPGKQMLADFVKKAKLAGIPEIGAIFQGSNTDVNRLRDFNIARANTDERFDWFVFEWEFWNQPNPDSMVDPMAFPAFLNVLMYAKATLAPLGVKIAVYLGWFNQDKANDMAPFVDLFMLHDYQSSPVYGYVDDRVHYLSNTGYTYDWVPIFSAEHKEDPYNAANNFMGKWYETHDFDDSFNAIKTDFDLDNHSGTVARSRLVGQTIFDWELIAHAIPPGSNTLPPGDTNFVTPTGPLTQCPGETVTLHAEYLPTGDVITPSTPFQQIVNYELYEVNTIGVIDTSPDEQPYDFIISVPGEYYVVANIKDVVDDGFGGWNYINGTVQSNSVLISYFSFSIPQPIIDSVGGGTCSQDVTELYVTNPQPNVGYLWDHNNETTPTISIYDPGIYTIRVAFVSPGGCLVWSDPFDLIISEKMPLVETISGGGSTCTGSGINGQLTVPNTNGDAYYHLYKNGVDTGTILQGNGSTLVFSLTTAGTYTVVAFVPDYPTCPGVLMNGSVNWVINPLPSTPTVSPTVSNPVCLPITLTSTVAPNGGSYEWSNGANTRSIVVTQNGSYRVRVTDGVTGCVSAWSSYTVITGRQLSSYYIQNDTGVTQIGCNGSSLLNLQLSQITVNPADSPNTWAWYKDGVLLVNGGDISGATSDHLSINNAGPGYYHCVIHFNTGNCDFVLPGINIELAPPVTYQPILNTPWIVCPGSDLLIELLNPDPRYQVDIEFVSILGGNSLGGGNPSSVIISYNDLISYFGATGTYTDTIRLYDPILACSNQIGSASIVLMDNVTPVITALNGVTTLYQGSTPAYATLNSDQSIGYWNNGQTGTQLLVYQSGEYWFTTPCGNESNHILITILPIKTEYPEGTYIPEEPIIQVKKPTLTFRRDNPYSVGYTAVYKDQRLETLHRVPILYEKDKIEKFHFVTEEDDICSIAFRYYGNSKFYWIILDVNKIEDAFDLPVGTNILIPNLERVGLK